MKTPAEQSGIKLEEFSCEADVITSDLLAAGHESSVSGSGVTTVERSDYLLKEQHRRLHSSLVERMVTTNQLLSASS